MIHYRCDTSSYRQLLGFIKQELGESIQLTIGSDGGQSIQSAVKQTFPNTIHLHCTRHVKKNSERHLLNTQLVLQDRQKTFGFSVRFTRVTYSGRDRTSI